MSKSKIGTIESIMLILTIVVTHTILALPRDLLATTKSATILNLIYVSIIAVLIAYLIFKLFKKFPGLDIIDIAKNIGGNTFQKIVGIIFITYFLVSSSILLRNFCEGLKTIYFPMTDITFIILVFIIALCIGNRLSFNATLKTNLLILPLVLFSMVFLFFSNMNKFVPERIFPILGDGIFNTFILGLTNIASFGGIAYLYFLPPLLKHPENFKKIAIFSVIITAIYLILCVSTLLFMFSFVIDANEISPLYNATRYVELGTFFQRLESVFLLLWILAFTCYLSIVCKFSMNIFEKITNIENKSALVDVFGLLILAIAILPKNLAVSQYFESSVYKYLVIGIVFALGIGILVIANIAERRRKIS